MFDPISLSIAAGLAAARLASKITSEETDDSRKGGSQVEFQELSEVEFPWHKVRKYRGIRCRE